MAGDDFSLSPSFFPLTVTTTAGTTKAAPTKTNVVVPPCVLTLVDLLIPPGHAGQTGFQLVQSGQVILPFAGAATDQWIIGNDVHELFDMDYPVGSGLVIQTFNTGKFNHSHYVRLRVDYNAYTGANVKPALSIVPSA